MNTTTKPGFIGGTLDEHVLFVLAMCRFQHHSVPLALLHYVTWSVVGTALHVLAFTLFGPLGPIVLALALTAWAMRLDVRVGSLFGLMQATYAWTVLEVLRGHMPSSAMTAGLALAAIVVAIATEGACHHVLQGYGPRPPASAFAGLRGVHKGAFVLYFVLTFGIFFLTLDLALRFVGLRRDLHLRANAIATGWHEEVAAGTPAAGSRELQWHRRAIAELAS